MEYELALKLKNAGFPQKSLEEGDFTLCQHCNGEPHEYNDTCDVIIIPTLSELIEACGDLDEIVIYITHNMVEVKGINPTYGFDLTVQGSTSEIAVANLWLALNKK